MLIYRPAPNWLHTNLVSWGSYWGIRLKSSFIVEFASPKDSDAHKTCEILIMHVSLLYELTDSSQTI
jgi:hypothetical protein